MTPETNLVDIYVGERLRELRERMQVTKAHLATTIGASLEQLERYERGLERVGADRLQRAARMLKVPPSDFFAHPQGSPVEMRERFHAEVCPICGSGNVVELRRAAGSVSDAGLNQSEM